TDTGTVDAKIAANCGGAHGGRRSFHGASDGPILGDLRDARVVRKSRQGGLRKIRGPSADQAKGSAVPATEPADDLSEFIARNATRPTHDDAGQSVRLFGFLAERFIQLLESRRILRNKRKSGSTGRGENEDQREKAAKCGSSAHRRLVMRTQRTYRSACTQFWVVFPGLGVVYWCSSEKKPVVRGSFDRQRITLRQPTTSSPAQPLAPVKLQL